MADPTTCGCVPTVYFHIHEKSMSRFQSQLTILQYAINIGTHVVIIFSDPHAETLSQIGVRCSYVLNVIIAKYVPFQRHFYDNKKRLIFFIVC